MEININRESVKLVFEKLAPLLNKIFPGVFVMEIFFKKGYFSNPPSNFIDLILFILWCVVLSIPFNFLQPPSVEFWHNNVREALEKEGNTKHLTLENDREKLGDMLERIIFGFILLKLSLTYFILKLISFYFAIGNYIDIPGIVWKYILSIVLITFLSWPFGFLYTFVITKLIFKCYYIKIKKF